LSGQPEAQTVKYGAVELPPLTQTKTQHKSQETRIVLCRQLWEVLCIVAAT